MGEVLFCLTVLINCSNLGISLKHTLEICFKIGLIPIDLKGKRWYSDCYTKCNENI